MGPDGAESLLMCVQRAPGRGAWIGVIVPRWKQRSKGQLKGALARRSNRPSRYSGQSSGAA